MIEALAKLRKMGAQGCVLMGNPKFYCRFGFKSYSYQLAVHDIPSEYDLALTLDNDIPQGMVTYQPVFDANE
jgi:putative acetyltransferase